MKKIIKDFKLYLYEEEKRDNTIDKNIIIECDNNNTFDSDFNDVEFYVVNGKINK